MTGRGNHKMPDEEDEEDEDTGEDNFEEDDVLDEEGYPEDEGEPRKTHWRKEREGDMTRKEAKDYPKVGEFLKQNPDTIKQIARKTGIPEDFMETVGPDLGNFLAKYLYMVMGGKGKALDPEKMKWFKDLKNDLEPLVKAFYKYFVKKQAGKMGLTDEDLQKMQEIQQSQGTDAAMTFLKERVEQAQAPQDVALPPEWQSEDGEIVVEDDRQVPLDPNAPPPARLMTQPQRGLPSIEELAARAGVAPEKLAPRGDMNAQKAMPLSSDPNTIRAMLAQERERIRKGDLYSQRKPQDYQLPSATSSMSDLNIAGADEIMSAMAEEAAKFRADNEQRMAEAQQRATKSATTPPVRPPIQTPQPRPVIPITPPLTTSPPPTKEGDDLLEPTVPEDFPSLNNLKKMKRPEVEEWARRIGLDPAQFKNKWELLEAIAKAVEGGN